MHEIIDMDEMIQAIQAGNTQAIQDLLQAQPTLANAKTEQGLSMVLLACYHQQLAIAKIIAEQKEQIDLFEATALGDLRIVKEMLIQSPGQVNEFAIDGFTPLGLASFFGHLAIVEHLLTIGAEVNTPSNNNFKVAPIHSAVARKNEAIAKLLIAAGADVNAAQMSGVRPLHSAAHLGDLAMVQLLLSAEAKVNVQTEEGLTPLQMAMEHQFAAVIDCLKAYGA